MKRYWVGCAALVVLFFQAGVALAQTTLDALEDELKEVKQQHDDATAQNLTNFFTQVDQAMMSPDAALALYQQAGGTIPPPTSVTTVHDSESASEREARQAQDQANTLTLGTVAQVHCGLLHFAGLYVTHPDQPNLDDDFKAWLQKAAQAYPHLGVVPASPAAANPDAGEGDAPNGGHHHHGNGGPSFNYGELRNRSMRESLITKFLNFKLWGDHEQGGWSIRGIPNLFKAKILDPSRAAPSQATLDAWDTYIAMANADEPDNDKWSSFDYPPLQFQRACDDFAVTPSTEKIEALVQIIHANPTYPQVDDWIKATKQLLDDYSSKHGGRPAPSTAAADTNAPPAAPTNSSVIVTSVQQGDATIITTHTNAAPNPAAPH